MNKKFFTALFVFMFVFVFSCSSEDMGEEVGGPPDDWDYGNVVSDDDLKSYDEDATEGEKPGEEESPSSDEDVENGENGNELAKGCGNEHVEYEERCDSPVPVECQNLNPNMDGIAYCAHDCLSYDLSSCSLKKGIWGVLNVRFRTNFILDGAKISDPAYFNKGSLPYAAFGAIYGEDEKQIPSKNQRSLVSFAVTSDYKATFGTKRQLFVKQNPVVGGVPGFPKLELEFAPGGIKKGSEYRINAISVIDFIDGLFGLVRFRLIENQEGIECIMGLGYSGSVYITDVIPENVDLFEGGSVEVVANNVIFYHPDDIAEMGGEPIPESVLNYPVCTK